MKRAILSILLACVLLGLAVQQFGWGPAWAALTHVSWPWLLSALLLQALIMLVKAWRWAEALRAAAGRPMRGIATATFVGFAGNLVLPARLGELARIHLAASTNHLSRSVVLSTIAVTQFLDLLLLGLLFFLMSFLFATEALIHPGVLTSFALGGLIALAGLVAVQHRWAALAALLARVTRVLPGPLRRASTYYAGQFALGLHLLAQRRAGMLVALATVTAWTLEIASYALALTAFGVTVTPLMPALLVVVLSLAFILPLTPANIGPHQFLCVLVLGLFDVNAGPALAFSLGLQAACALLVLALGGYGLLRCGLAPRTLYRAVRAVQSPSSTTEVAEDDLSALSRPEGPISPTGGRDSARAPARVRELHVCARTDG